MTNGENVQKSVYAQAKSELNQSPAAIMRKKPDAEFYIIPDTWRPNTDAKNSGLSNACSRYELGAALSVASRCNSDA